MATVVVIDPNTGEEDTKISEYLASSAKLSASARVLGKESFTCPRTGKDLPVIMIQYSKEGQTLEAAGVEIKYRGTIWECWSGGITTKNKEYFRVRARDPLFYTIGRNGFGAKPNVTAYGNIFVNEAADGTQTYKLSLRSIAQSAKNELAEKLVTEGHLDATTIMNVDGDVDFDNVVGATKKARTSNVTLG